MIVDNIKFITAEEGMMLTDGKIIAKSFMLPENRTADEFTEITKVEADERQKKLELLEAINEHEETAEI